MRTRAGRRPAAAGYFIVPAAQLSHLQLVAGRARPTWTTVLRTTGTVDWDNDHTTQAITQVSGPISRLLVDTGRAREEGGSPPLRQQPRRQQRHLGVPQGEEPPRSGAAQPRSQQGSARAQGDRAARFRIGAGRLQRRRDRRRDGAAGAEDFRRDERGHRRGRAAERRHPARAGDARADRRHRRPEAGPARAVHPGGHDRGVRDQRRVDAVGAGAHLRQGSAVDPHR